MKKTHWSLPILLALLVSACSTPISPMNEMGLVPLPKSISVADGSYELNEESAIMLSGEGEQMEKIGEYLASNIRPATGFELPVTSDRGDLVLELTAQESSEAYQLDVTEEGIKISAASEAGLFYGVQTLLQLFPVEIEDQNTANVKWEVPMGSISDEPEFGYRGSMLDVSRHFFPVEDVKHYIDQMAILKLNYLHLHLSDDQGWRIEIKSWPKLTEIGGSTEVGGGDGGFYTQEDYKEIVAYAADNFITIVPEIDMPGHTNAALASYAELNPGVNLPNGVTDSLSKSPIDYNMPLSNPQAAELYTGREVGFSTFATDLELTYEFVDDVVREISEITPGPYFHIGGDESHVTEKDDYIFFIERVQDIVKSHGKINMGWDEVATAELLSGTVAQFWALEDNAKLAKDQGNQVLMSPAKKAYIDMQYDSTTQLGLHWAAYIELDDAYNWNPATYVEGIDKSDILGVEAPLWTETITNREDIEFMAFPRLAAIAEVAWTPESERNWESFQKRIAIQGKRWDLNSIGFYKSPKVDWK